MNPHLFSAWGYGSVVLWFAVPVLWVLHTVRRPRRWLAHLAVGVALAALLFAKLNSVLYVNRIEVDRSEQIAEAQARQEAARQAALKARGDDVAQIHFVEDDAGDYLDAAGLDEADRKYLESIEERATPAWRKTKQTRSGATGQDAGLEGLLNPAAPEAGMEVGVLEQQSADRQPIAMPEADVLLANRLDTVNLKLIRGLLLAAVLFVCYDYLRRLNVYEEAYAPLPLSGALVNSVNPMPAWRAPPAAPRRTMPEELAWIARRGDVFLYLAGNAAKGAAVPERLYRLPRKTWPVDVLRVTDDDPAIDDDFIFEGLWYGRAAFVVDSAAGVERLMARLVERLHRRTETRARVKQTVHVVWDLAAPMPEPLRTELLRLAGRTGWTVLEAGASRMTERGAA